MKSVQIRIPVIETFLEAWRKTAYEYYLNSVREGKEIEKKHRKWVEEQKKEYKSKGDNWFDMLGHTHWKETVFKYWNENKMAYNLISYGKEEYIIERLNNILDSEVESKRISLISRTEKKIGGIIDATELYIADDGSINGFILGENGKAEINTIYAGGYNIQCLHYRVLIKVL